MEENIKRVACLTRWMYGCFWILPVLVAFLGEAGEGWTGVYAGNARAVYWAETAIILLTALLVPVSLKLFSRVLVKKIDRAAISDALRLYALWSGARLVLLTVPVLAGMLAYYMMWSGKGLLCALIALTASLFCLPGEERLRKELHIYKER